MMASLPKGPWKVKEGLARIETPARNDGGWSGRIGAIVTDADGRWIVLVQSPCEPVDEAFELARAISALPELIEAARGFVDMRHEGLNFMDFAHEVATVKIRFYAALRIVDGEPDASPRTIHDGPKMDWSDEPIQIGSIVFPGVPADCRAWPEFRPKHACPLCYTRWDLHDDDGCGGRKP